jgi:hypothetical protein
MIQFKRFIDRVSHLRETQKLLIRVFPEHARLATAMLE